ncbi:MAG: hypothetical protein KDA72_08565 [Planctomycetales bacterium]|nr:hypothetical protein [Planctomycetales bacterium]
MWQLAHTKILDELLETSRPALPFKTSAHASMAGMMPRVNALLGGDADGGASGHISQAGAGPKVLCLL